MDGQRWFSYLWELAQGWLKVLAFLPSDLTPFQKNNEQISSHEPCNMPPLSAIQAQNVSSFGRRAQAVCLLDQVLNTINSPPRVVVDCLELEKLDQKILSFLEVILRRVNTAYFPSIAFFLSFFFSF